jgi:hypothetical protein
MVEQFFDWEATSAAMSSMGESIGDFLSYLGVTVVAPMSAAIQAGELAQAGVFNAVDASLGNAETSASQAVDDAAQMVDASLTDTEGLGDTPITDTEAQVDESLSETEGAAKGTVDTTEKKAQDGLATTIKTVTDTVTVIVDRVKASLGGMTGGIGAFLSIFFAAYAEVETIRLEAEATLAQESAKALTGLPGAIASEVGKVLENAPLFSLFTKLAPYLGEALASLKLADPSRYKSMIGSFTPEDEHTVMGLSGLGMIAGAPLGFLPFLQEYYSSGVGRIIQQQALYAFRPTPLGLGDAVNAKQRGLMSTGTYLEAAGRAGVTNDDAWLYLQSQMYRLDVNEIRQLWLRGLLSDDERDERLQALGITEEQIPQLIALWLPIPGPDDLIRMAVREAFSPEIAERFGQYQDLPAKFVEHAHSVGLSDEWARAYWAAHWDLPSPQMGFEMLQRGIISREDLELLLRALDVMPFWRDRLIKLSYNPLTRIDVRRMHKLGILDRGGVYAAHLAIGYSPEDAERLTVFTLALNTEEKKAERAPEKDLTKAEVISLYRAGVIETGACSQMLAAVGYDPEEIGQLITLADYASYKETRADLVENIKLRYQKGLLDKSGAQAALDSMGLLATETETYLLKWAATKPVSARFPSITQLAQFVKAALMSLDDYEGELLDAGYTVRHAKMFRQLLSKGVAVVAG